MLSQAPNSEFLKRQKIFIYTHRFFKKLSKINKGYLNGILTYKKPAFAMFCS